MAKLAHDIGRFGSLKLSQSDFLKKIELAQVALGQVHEKIPSHICTKSQ